MNHNSHLLVFLFSAFTECRYETHCETTALFFRYFKKNVSVRLVKKNSNIICLVWCVPNIKWQIRAVNEGIKNVTNFENKFQPIGCQAALSTLISMKMELKYNKYLFTQQLPIIPRRRHFLQKIIAIACFFYLQYLSGFPCVFPFLYAPQDALRLLSIGHQTLELLFGCLGKVTKRLEIVWYTCV